MFYFKFLKIILDCYENKSLILSLNVFYNNITDTRFEYLKTIFFLTS